ncbi:J domain-containing protein [Thiomicrospira sp. ALE5]|uniref:J domain-containing protein n=1 Tax=Thiomicrospira sp. ALE5 TaxID=748650 RepID=UPI0008DEC8EC|nr:DnaJ domain-containing protein [Thiomicrospira sp. ALE5]SFR54960.1 DnaJ domain-containing protein [Thiomicrospira sp. ALE5]
MSKRTHYDNLKISQNASLQEIKAAYRKLAKKHHPDRNNNSDESIRIMKILNSAYETLTDPLKRQKHDTWIKEESQMIKDTDEAIKYMLYLNEQARLAEWAMRPQTTAFEYFHEIFMEIWMIFIFAIGTSLLILHWIMDINNASIFFISGILGLIVAFKYFRINFYKQKKKAEQRIEIYNDLLPHMYNQIFMTKNYDPSKLQAILDSQ